jgi:lysophospholipase L1-like esterase
MWDRFVALGDSFTEGLDDPGPNGTFRGWADLVAARLAADSPEFRYANLAVRGRLLRPILTEQIPAAIVMTPNLISLAGGGNDILRPRCDIDDLGERFYAGVAQLSATGATVVLFAGFNPARIPLGPRLRNRALVLNTHVRRAAADFGATLVDLWNMPALESPDLWSEDRLHLSTRGHERVAVAVLEALGVKTDTGPLSVVSVPRGDEHGWLAARRDDARWSRQHLAPWVIRRLSGRSSGDGVEPKRPELEPLDPP